MRVPIAAFLMLLACAGLLVQGTMAIKTVIYLTATSGIAVALFLYCLRAEYRPAMAVQSLAIVVGLPLIAWSFPSLGMLQLVMCIWVPLMASRFNLIAPVYLLSLLLLPGLDQSLAIGSLKLFEFGVHDGMAIGATFAVLLNPARGRPRAHYDFAALALILLIGVALSRDTSASHFLRTMVSVIFDLWLPYFILSRSLKTIEDLRIAILWLGCGAMVLGALLTFEAWKSWPVYNELYQHYRLPTLLLVKARAGVLRSGGPFVEPTAAALVLSICIAALWLSRGYFRSNRHMLLLLAVTLVGLSAPQSRGAWTGLILAMALADWFRGRYVQLVGKMVLVGGAGAALFLAAQFSPYISENIGLTGGASDTSEYRRMLLDRGLQEFWHRPVLGYSVPELQVRLRDMRQGEGIIDFVNAYIWIMLISGGVGLIIFIGSLAVFTLNMLRMRRLSRVIEGAREAGAFGFVALAMLIEMLMFTSFGGRTAYLLFAMFGFSAASRGVSRRAVAEAAVPEGHEDEPPPDYAIPAPAAPPPAQDARYPSVA